MSSREHPSSGGDAVRCKACQREMPHDALLCPYCGTSVLAALPPAQTAEPAPGPFPPETRPGRRGSWSRWVPVAGAWAFLLVSVTCCLMAVVAVSYTPGGRDLWRDLLSSLEGTSSQSQAEPTVTPVASEPPVGPEPTQTPAAPTVPSPLGTPTPATSPLALPADSPASIALLLRNG